MQKDGTCIFIEVGEYIHPIRIEHQVDSPIPASNDNWYSVLFLNTNQEMILPECYIKQHEVKYECNRPSEQ